jgi:hypothetical protein
MSTPGVRSLDDHGTLNVVGDHGSNKSEYIRFGLRLGLGRALQNICLIVPPSIQQCFPIILGSQEVRHRSIFYIKFGSADAEWGQAGRISSQDIVSCIWTR